MTRNPPMLLELQHVFEARIGPFWKGTVGDENHFYGYHLGGWEVATDDYSRVLARDLYGIDKYGGTWAAAVDIGMSWPASRDWLKWLVSETSKGNFPGIREVIGSMDGKTCWEWDVPTRGVNRRPDDHIAHTHISFYRDAIFHNHNYLFDTWTPGGRVLPAPSTTTSIGPRPTFVLPTPLEVDELHDSIAAENVPFWGPRTVIIAAGVGGLAWIIRRRMEREHEGS